jgi:ribonuclease P protein component
VAQPIRQPHPLKLTRAAEYLTVLASECRLSGKNFFLRARSNELVGARLGLIASRKAARRAVDRNRGKRLAREAFRAVSVRLPAVDIVLQLKNDLRKSDNPDLRKELDRLLREVAARFGNFGTVDPQSCNLPPTQQQSA